MEEAITATQAELVSVAAWWDQRRFRVTTAVERGNPRHVIPTCTQDVQVGWLATPYRRGAAAAPPATVTAVS